MSRYIVFEKDNAADGSGDPETMFGALEEHLNYHDHILETTEGEPLTDQLDLLIPVRRRRE